MNTDTPKLYISLYHGRIDPKKSPKDWGTNGPIIGPVDISWTYGQIKIHKSWEEWRHLRSSEDNDMIYFDEVYYGDFEIVFADDPLVLGAAQHGRPVYSYDQAVDIIDKIQTIRI